VQAGESHIAARHERERREEMFAELPVRDPWATFFVRSERQRVDEDRTPAMELHVVRTRIAQGHTARERARLHIEGEQRCVA
jgi:hypothetical protein